jgi:isochorismate synthase
MCDTRPEVDLVELAAAASDAGQSVALFTRTDPGARSLVGIGTAFEIVATAEGAALEDAAGRRLDVEPDADPVAAADRLWRRLAPALGPRGEEAGSGPVAIGGFAHRPAEPARAPWEGFGGLLLRVPEVSVLQLDGRTEVWGDQRLLQAAPLAKGPAARRLGLQPSRPPDEWMAAVAAASERLRSGQADKVVLAREVLARGEGVLAGAKVARALRRAYPACYTWLLTGADGSTFVGASPELLARRAGSLAESLPLAGTTARGRDAAEDERLAQALLASGKDTREHRVTADFVIERLRGLSQTVDAGRPEILRLPNLQHLATRVSADLADPPPSVLALGAALHPTPAVGGFPVAAALALARELEQMERGWYAGAVGWVDAAGDGELAIAIRCGLLWEDAARLFAGNGVMPDSDPAQELRETELKLRPLLDALVD